MDEVKSKSESKEYKINEICAIEKNKNQKVIQTRKYRYL
jgi:hypothetical protein